MGVVLKWVDEVVGAREEPVERFELRLVSERITVAELIRRRVEHEVAEASRQPLGVFRGLAQPATAEEALDGVRVERRKPVELEEQVRRALEAFEARRFFLLFDDRQVESLAEELVVSEVSLARFVRLTPLVGG